MSQQTQVNTTKQDDEMEIDLLEIFYFLKAKVIWLILAFVVGALAAGLVTKFFISPKYKATAKVYMVSASSDSVVDLTDLNIGTSLSEDYKQLIQVRPVFEDVIKALNLSYTYEQLQNMTTIDTIGKTRLIAITVESKDPAEARDIANELSKMAVSYIPKIMETSAPHIAETAILPKHKSSPSLAKNTLLGALICMLLLAGIFVVQYLLDDTFKSAEDVEKVLGVMPLTVIPEGVLSEIDDKAEKKIHEKKKKERKANGK